MIGEQIQVNNDGTATVSAKIPGELVPLLKIIAEMKGAAVNSLVKMCLLFLVETAKVTTDASPDMKVLLNMMKVDANWQTMFNYFNKGDLDVAQAILILQQSNKGKPQEGFGIAMFDKPFFGECRQTLSKDMILERVVEIVMGRDDYLQLRQIGVEFESNSIRETLSRMIDAQIIANLDDADRQELPALGNAADNGRPIQYGRKTKAKQHRTPDSLARDQRIKFDDDDRQQADAEAGVDLADEVCRAIGSKPFDVEP